MQLCLRSAALIIHGKEPAQIPRLLEDLKPLKIKLPKAIMEKLTELKGGR